MKEYPKHIKELIDEAGRIPYDTFGYWKLRCHYLEKSLDTTYSDEERRNCRILYDILKYKS